MEIPKELTEEEIAHAIEQALCILMSDSPFKVTAKYYSAPLPGKTEEVPCLSVDAFVPYSVYMDDDKIVSEKSKQFVSMIAFKQYKLMKQIADKWQFCLFLTLEDPDKGAVTIADFETICTKNFDEWETIHRRHDS